MKRLSDQNEGEEENKKSELQREWMRMLKHATWETVKTDRIYEVSWRSGTGVDRTDVCRDLLVAWRGVVAPETIHSLLDNRRAST
jgi:hypothetical protein